MVLPATSVIVHVIFAVPFFLAFTTPFSTVATFEFELFHEIDLGIASTGSSSGVRVAFEVLPFVVRVSFDFESEKPLSSL